MFSSVAWRENRAEYRVFSTPGGEKRPFETELLFYRVWRCGGGTPLVSSASSAKSSVDQSELFRATRLGIVQTLRVYKQRNVAGLTALSEMELTFTIVQFLLYPLHTTPHYKSCVTSARSSDGDPLEYCPSI